MSALAALTRDQVLLLQRRVLASGQDIGRAGVDGRYGPDTLGGQLCYVADRKLGAIGTLLARALIAEWRKHGITTPLRMAHFTAQAAHETMGFRHFVELGSGDGPDTDPWDDYLERYDYRADLGQNAGGLGERYRGRSPFHLTGLDNYRRMSARVGVDLVAHPERAAEPELGAAISCLFWADNRLEALADADDVLAMSRAINLGSPRSKKTPNGLADRRAKLARAKYAWGIA